MIHTTRNQIRERILAHARANLAFWADEVPLGDIPDARKNAIGAAFRSLARQGYIVRLSVHRRSTAPRARGRTVFRYASTNRS